MNKLTALKYIDRIEAHRKAEEAIWDEMRAEPTYERNEDNTLKDIIDRRADAASTAAEADADLDAFNWVDDGSGNLVPA